MLWMCIKERNLPCETLRVGIIIAVESSNVFPAGLVQASIACSCDPRAGGIGNKAHARIGKTSDNVGRCVSRSVVNDDQLKIFEMLSQDAADSDR
jgi:hypothetical protein